MKKLLLAILLTSFAVSLSFGANTCTGITNGVLSGTLDTFLTNPSSLTNCDYGDKIFSNFTYSGTMAASNVKVQISQGAGSIYQVIFTPVSGSFTDMTQLGFDVAVDTTNFPYARIVQFQDQMNTAQVPPSGFTPNASTEVATHTGFTTLNLNALSGANETGQTAKDLAIAATTSITYDPLGNNGLAPQGQAFSFEVDVIQTSVPEPMTMSMMGIGLFAVGAFARRIRQQ